jgi:phenylalanyl-tRNA synthetase beta chain
VKVLLSWLREFVAVHDSAEAIARTMSVRGFAVEGIEEVAGTVGQAVHGGITVAGASGPDAVIDFEVTANRPDCMSIIGIAREVAVAYGLPHLTPAETDLASDDRGAGAVEGSAPGVFRDEAPRGGPANLEIVIENPELCPRYVGAIAAVSVGPSPAWIQARLHASAIRPISNIVDVTNYVLLEMGHPMHAFDLARLSGPHIRVRPARAGETLRTLDGQNRVLSPDMLVIADPERAVAVAGVMGGADSEVTDATTTIVLESAYFNPASVRRTSKKLGLKTEASMRFERGADPGLPAAAMRRAISLIEMIGAGSARAAVVDQNPKRIEPGTLRLRRSRIAAVLGAPIPDPDVLRILNGLGFVLRDGEDGWQVTIPTRRVDVAREVDLIEEVARHYGFDRVPVTFPAVTSAPPPLDPRIARARQLRGILTGGGFSEAVTFGFMSEPAAVPFAAEGDLVAIANPLSENFAVLRPSVLPGLIDAVAHNRRREQRDVRLFEIGARFTRGGGEGRAVACAWTGMAAPEHWSGSGRPVDFFDVRAIVERVCETVGVEVHASASGRPWLTPGQAADVMSNGTSVGSMGQLLPTLADAHGLPAADPVYVAEIDLDLLERLAAGRALRVAPLPRYPSVTRDISILIDDRVTADAIKQTIHDAAPPTLVRISEFDRYQGKGIPDGRVSLSLHLTFRSSDRTLTDVEVQAAMDQIIAALKERHGAVQR